MARWSALFLTFALAGCAALPRPPAVQAVSPCAVHEASWACQIERYHNVNVE